MNENIEKVLAVLDGFRMSDEMTYSAYSILHDEISMLDDLLKAQEPHVMTPEEVEKVGQGSKEFLLFCRVADALDAIPSVPAVPLDKLCEWMALRFGYPCKIIDDCNAWYVSECTESEAKKADCWRRVLTKWMEGLDEAD